MEYDPLMVDGEQRTPKESGEDAKSLTVYEDGRVRKAPKDVDEKTIAGKDRQGGVCVPRDEDGDGDG